MPEKKTITFSYQQFLDWDELDENHVQLLRHAAQAAAKAYAPYSKFRVGAAIKMHGGRLVLGSNQENASFPAGCCAERTALHAAMVSDADGQIEVIAIVAPSMPGKAPASPCGVCRQALVEQEGRQGSKLRVLLGSPGGMAVLLDSAADLLPLSFNGGFLTQ